MSGDRFEVRFGCPAAEKDYNSLDGSTRVMVDKGLFRLEQRADEIGKALSGALSGCKELKFRAGGIKMIYRIVNGHVEVVQIIAIGARDKGRVFEIAARRIAEIDRLN